MEVNAIRPHLDGTIDVSDDYGLTWKKFEGIVINAAFTEHVKELNQTQCGAIPIEELRAAPFA